MVSQRGNLLAFRIGLTIAIIALFVGGVRKYWLQRSTPRTQDLTQVTGLYVDPKRLNFGKNWEDDHFAWVLPIENRSTFDVTIERFYNSCVCTEIKPRSILIPAGQSREIRLIIDLMTKLGYGKSTGAIRDFAVRVEAVVAKPDGSRVNQPWEVQGQVKRAIELEQPEIDFGMHSEREQPLPMRRIAVKSLTPLDSLAVTGGLADFPFKVIRRPTEPSTFDLEISPERVLPEAKYNFSLSVVPVLSNGSRLPAKTLPVRAWIIPDVQAFPPEIQFGAVQIGDMAENTMSLASFQIGDMAENTMSLASLTGKAFTIKDWHCTSDLVKIERQESNRREKEFHIQWNRVTSLGQHEAEVIIRIKTDKKEEKVIKVPIKCLGIGKSVET